MTASMVCPDNYGADNSAESSTEVIDRRAKSEGPSIAAESDAFCHFLQQIGQKYEFQGLHLPHPNYMD